MECDQVKEKLEDTNVTAKEVTLKSHRFASLENNHIAIYSIKHWPVLCYLYIYDSVYDSLCLLWTCVYYCIVERSGGINVCINWNSVYNGLHDVYIVVDVSTWSCLSGSHDHAGHHDHWLPSCMFLSPQDGGRRPRVLRMSLQ